MPLSRSRDYLSIGEVLDQIRPEFPDVSISKIRFLEAEGLIEPERTPSGYRKFYDQDVSKLRFILGLQRDHFLPLKVIKDRLASAGNGGSFTLEAPPPPSALGAASVLAAPAPRDRAAQQESAPPIATEVSLTVDELKKAAGISEAELKGLVDYGLLEGTKTAYDGDDLLAAKAAAGLFRYGVEPRHLKMYRNFAEREASFFEQIVAPLAHRKDPDAQREATRSMSDIVTLASRFRDAMLRSSMRDVL